jgi:hypothetical protein
LLFLLKIVNGLDFIAIRIADGELAKRSSLVWRGLATIKVAPRSAACLTLSHQMGASSYNQMQPRGWHPCTHLAKVRASANTHQLGQVAAAHIGVQNGFTAADPRVT